MVMGWLKPSLVNSGTGSLYLAKAKKGGIVPAFGPLGQGFSVLFSLVL
jgi:hypothetical protein